MQNLPSKSKPPGPPRARRSKTKSFKPATKTGEPPPGSSSGGTPSSTGESTGSSPSTSTSPPSSPASNQDVEAKLEARLKVWRTNLPDYCREVLKIRTKMGDLIPFELNRAQQHLHAALEQQLQDTGKVRAIVLKGRQQGISTYIQARFYWRTSIFRGRRAQILTHRLDATDHLFGMADRFWQHAPVRPRLDASNAKELAFAEIDSGYQVATAGSKATGRSTTCQLFHGSEVAFWDAAEDHMAGVGQIVPDMPGTEMILESTANGLGNLYHRFWQAAERGQSSYLAVFIPWFWQSEYSRPVPPGFVPTDEEMDYASAHKLTVGQLAWRRAKIVDDFAGDVNRFRQEYPATPAEAFVAVGHDSLIDPAVVLAARGRAAEPSTEGIIVGVDPARFGKNSTCIARRKGRKCLPIERLAKKDTMAVAGRIAVMIREEKPLRVFIDVGGLGGGVYDRLAELGYADVVTAINFGETAGRSDRYANKRAEMWGEMRDWLPRASIPPDDVLAADMTGPTYRYDSDGRLVLEKKEDMLRRGIQSPDSADALALTFAMPIAAVASQRPGGRAWEDMIDAFAAVTDQSRVFDGIETG